MIGESNEEMGFRFFTKKLEQYLKFTPIPRGGEAHAIRDLVLHELRRGDSKSHLLISFDLGRLTEALDKEIGPHGPISIEVGNFKHQLEAMFPVECRMPGP